MVSIIVAVIELIGIIATVVVTNRKTVTSISGRIDVIDERINNLAEKVDMHNNFAVKIPVMETKINFLERELERETRTNQNNSN